MRCRSDLEASMYVVAYVLLSSALLLVLMLVLIFWLAR
jgi:hypothetical protein